KANGVLITRGGEGMSLFEAGKVPLHLPVHRLSLASEIVDTNGAGDTVAATFTLALTAGASMAEAAYLANAAAALVVRRLGAASNTPGELMSVTQWMMYSMIFVSRYCLLLSLPLLFRRDRAL